MTRSHIAFPVPTVWFRPALAAATGLALFAWPGRSWWALVVVEIVLAALFVLDGLACVAPRRIAIQREVAESGTLGEPMVLTWLVDNNARRCARVTITDALWPSLGAERRSVSVTLRSSAASEVANDIAADTPRTVPPCTT